MPLHQKEIMTHARFFSLHYYWDFWARKKNSPEADPQVNEIKIMIIVNDMSTPNLSRKTDCKKSSALVMQRHLWMDEADKFVAKLIMDQIDFANVIIMNKTNLFLSEYDV